MTSHSVTLTRPARQRRPVARDKWSRTVPLALIVLSLIPVIFGSLRLVEIAGGPQLMPSNPRIDASPAPLVVHVLGATVYALLGAFQFSARLRRRHLNLHRKSGRVLVGAGVAVALSGLWITLFTPAHRVGACCGPSGSWSAPRWPRASCWDLPRSAAATSPPTGPG